MLPDIGIMVGLYIITRMLYLVKKNDSVLVRIFAVITIIAAVLCTLDLLLRGVPTGAG